MASINEFVIFDEDDGVTIYAPSTFPRGTPIGYDSRRLSVVGSSPVRSPKIHMTNPEFDQWRTQLEEAGYTVTIGPFWRDRPTKEEIDEDIRLGRTIPLKEAFDELLRRAEAEGR